MSGDWGSNGEDTHHLRQQLSSIDRMCGVDDTPNTPPKRSGCGKAATGLMMALGGVAELAYQFLRGTGRVS